MNDAWDSADIDAAKAELLTAGWVAKTSTIWKSPSGKLHVGPAGAWKVMKRAQNDLAASKSAHPAHQERTEPQEESEIVATLRERMRWYRDGCPDLEDTPVYFVSGDCARDAAGDLETALGEIERLTKGAPARAAEWQPLTSAPKDGTPLWLVEDGALLGLTIPHQFAGVWVSDTRYAAGGAWLAIDRDYIGQPIAWMPLPLPPCALTGSKETK